MPITPVIGTGAYVGCMDPEDDGDGACPFYIMKMAVRIDDPSARGRLGFEFLSGAVFDCCQRALVYAFATSSAP